MAKVLYSTEIQDLRGRRGGAIFSRARNGATAKNRSVAKSSQTPLQTLTRANLALANAALHTLTAAQVTAWKTFAARLTTRDTVTGHGYSPAWNTVFSGCAMKFLQINPGADVPTDPPSGPFYGDKIAVTAENFGGELTFFANGANADDVMTELLIEKLPSRQSRPSGKYLSQEFVAFSGPGNGQSLTLDGGHYAPAYRFVNIYTGQMTPLYPLPPLEI